VAQGSGDKLQALKLIRAAASLEDGSEKHVAMENRLYPMRELLADMLMLHGDPAAALQEYETSMKSAANRLRGLYGAAQAAQATGDESKRSEYLGKLALLTQSADTDRAEVRQVQTTVKSR
jgi:uncharacterized protein HemY